MEFGSIIFLTLFLPLFLLLYFLVPGRLKLIVSVFCGFIFYYWNAGNGILILFFSILFNFLLGRIISKKKDRGGAGAVLAAGVIINIVLLIYFKYLNFFLNNLFSLFSSDLSFHNGTFSWFPYGISFFTFVAISYLIDIYRGGYRAFSRLSDAAFLFSFFPKVMAGPITMHASFSPSISEKRVYIYDFDNGIRRIIYGLAKKILIADHILKVANNIFSIPSGDLTLGLSWLGAISYTLAIFLDFSGYSDIAIGIGRILGYQIPENFNYPYISVSIKEFWKRWHISLSNWLQTYLFLPTAYLVMRKIKVDRFGGMKIENIAYITASFLTMSLCGLWHGASWTFTLWGSFHGILLVFEHLFLRKFMRRKKYFFIKWTYAQLMIIAGWVIFKSESVSYAIEYLKSMTGFGSGTGKVYFPELYLNSYVAILLVLGIIVSFPLTKYIKKLTVNFTDFGQIVINVQRTIIPALLFLFILIEISSGTYNPFIYFRF